MNTLIICTKKFRNRVVAEQRKSKIGYFQKYFETNKTNMKMLWSGIRSIVNMKKRVNCHKFHIY